MPIINVGLKNEIISFKTKDFFICLTIKTQCFYSYPLYIFFIGLFNNFNRLNLNYKFLDFFIYYSQKVIS